MNDSDVFFRAAEIIEERGHTKGVLEDRNGRVCLLGAIYAAITGNPNTYGDSEDRHFPLLHNTVFGYKTNTYGDVVRLVDWNNAKERTPTEVIDALIHTGKMVKEGGC